MPPERSGRAIGADTRVFALLGDPVAHSLSPRIQNAALAAADLDGVYVALRCDADEVEPLMRALARAGGGGNVTVPHKRTAAAAVRGTAAVERTGACNTFWLERDELAGDNTDVAGFSRTLRDFIGDLAGSDVLLLGAGGGAAAALVALLDAGAGRVSLHNRTPSHAHELVARVAPGDARVRLLGSLDDARADAFDLVVNATTLGLHPGDALPLPVAETPAYGAAFDLVYGPEGTPWTREVAAAGLPARDGRDMLLHQAAAAFERWWPTEAPLGAMRAALVG